MTKLPKKFVDRVAPGLKKYQRIALTQQKADVAEADTVTLVKDILADVFGYDKYDELTAEHQIKGTFCDLAIKIAGQLRLLIEVKSAGSALSESHLRQVIDYGAHQGIHWVILTNAIEWRLVRIYVANQISHEEVCRVAFTELNARNEDHLQQLFLFAKEGLTTDAMDAFHQQAQLFKHGVGDHSLRASHLNCPQGNPQAVSGHKGWQRKPCGTYRERSGQAGHYGRRQSQGSFCPYKKGDEQARQGKGL